MKFNEIIFFIIVLFLSYYIYTTFDFATLPSNDMFEDTIKNFKDLKSVDLESLYKKKVMPSKNVLNIFSFRFTEQPKQKQQTVLIPKENDKKNINNEKQFNSNTVSSNLDSKLVNSYSLIGFMNKDNKKYAFLSSSEGVQIKTLYEMIDEVNRIINIRSDAEQNSVTIENIKTGQQFIIKLVNR